jgi:hypothetical protein
MPADSPPSPLDVLYQLRNCAHPVTDEDHDAVENADPALAAVEQLVEAARAADFVLYEHMPEWYGDTEWNELDYLRAALALFPPTEGVQR